MCRKLAVIVVLVVAVSSLSFAGNKERTGEAGAYELLMDGWARTSGTFGMNTARMRGIESMRYNVGGLAKKKKTEFSMSYTRALTTGSASEAYNIIKGGFAQKLGEDNVLGFAIQSMDYGEFDRTTTTSPEGNIGTYSPRAITLGVAFSRAFSNSIYAGALFRYINENAGDVRANGFSLDAGIQYVTGPKDNIHFGVSIRNLGTPMTFNGDGLAFRGPAPEGDFDMTQSMRSAKFNLPSQLHIGAAYDFYFGAVLDTSDETAKNIHRVTASFNFTSNSVGKDHFGVSAEYSYREMFFARFGYRMEPGIFNEAERTTAYLGFAGGVGAEVKVTKKGNKLGIDYSYRPTSPFNGGTHSVGVRFML
jgi:hypothetical protein